MIDKQLYVSVFFVGAYINCIAFIALKGISPVINLALAVGRSVSRSVRSVSQSLFVSGKAHRKIAIKPAKTMIKSITNYQKSLNIT